MRKKSSPNPRPFLFRIIADEIASCIKTGTLRRLGSIRDMARERQVSYQTMWKAVQELVKEGVVRCYQGKTLCATGMQTDSPAPLPGTLARVVDSIKQRILDGTWQAEDALPKVTALAPQESVSQNTIIEALRHLGKVRLIHKKGKRWFAGPPAPKANAAQLLLPDANPVIVLLMDQQRNFHHFFNRDHTAAFAIPFRNEVTRYNMRLALALNEHDPAFPISDTVATGVDDVVSMIRSLGKRYSGTLISGISIDRARAVSWIDEFMPYGKPVVFFDGLDAAGTQSIAKKTWKHFYRMHFSERNAMACALDALVQLGHSSIGIPVFSQPHFEWTMHRRDLIIDEAGRTAKSLHVAAEEMKEPFWRFETDSIPVTQPISNVERFMCRQLEKENAVTHKIQRFSHELMKLTPSLASLIRKHKPTAIIALNDMFARELYFWLQSVGASVPERMSLVSFDNIPQSTVFPISTVDFGFAQLGYLAAHAFIGDIPIKADAQGNIPGTCRVINRGSLAKPPRKPFEIV